MLSGSLEVKEGKWETRSVFQGGSAAVFSSLLVRDPTRHDRRALGGRVQFPDQRIAVVDVQALLELDDLHPFSGQSAPNEPLGVTNIQLALAVDLQHPGPGRILPARRVQIVAPRTRRPAAGRGLHAQRFMGPQIVMLPAVAVQPLLRWLSAQAAPRQSTFQSTMKALYLA